jgi:hypothetical protein
VDQKLFIESAFSSLLEQISTNSLILNEAIYILVECMHCVCISIFKVLEEIGL